MHSTTPHQYLVLNNILINSYQQLTILELRLLMATLLRLRPGREHEEVAIPLKEIVSRTNRNPSGSDYQVVDRLETRLTQELLLVPVAGQTDKATRLALFDYIHQEKNRGLLRVKLSEALRPYVASKSGEQITIAPYCELLKIKKPASFHVYWLLREYADFGERTIELAQLKRLLSPPGTYHNSAIFRKQKLEMAQQELSTTDMAFSMRELRRGKRVEAIHFEFQPITSKLNAFFLLQKRRARLDADPTAPTGMELIVWILGGWALAFVLATCLTAKG